jgi:hypothetical protein
MQTKTKIMIAAAVAGGIVIVSQRKKLMALVSTPVAGFGEGAPVAPAVLQQTAVTTQGVAQIVNTMVTSLAGIAGLAIAAMTLTEKRRALAKG